MYELDCSYGRLHVGYRRDAAVEVFFSGTHTTTRAATSFFQSDPKSPQPATLLLESVLEDGTVERVNPGEVAWLPFFNHAYIQAETCKEQHEIRDARLVALHKYLTERDPSRLQDLERQLSKPSNGPFRLLLLDKAQQWRRCQAVAAWLSACLATICGQADWRRPPSNLKQPQLNGHEAVQQIDPTSDINNTAEMTDGAAQDTADPRPHNTFFRIPKPSALVRRRSSVESDLPRAKRSKPAKKRTSRVNKTNKTAGIAATSGSAGHGGDTAQAFTRFSSRISGDDEKVFDADTNLDRRAAGTSAWDWRRSLHTYIGPGH